MDNREKLVALQLLLIDKVTKQVSEYGLSNSDRSPICQDIKTIGETINLCSSATLNIIGFGAAKPLQDGTDE